MTAAEIAAWQSQHGGAAGSEGPDANGITVHRAADGSFINVDASGNVRMRGHGAPVEGAPSPTPETPAAPPRGMGMTQQELEAILARLGPLGPNDFREETKTEDIPNPAAASNGGLDPQAPTTIKGPVRYQTWIKPGTNIRLTVKVNPDGTYEQTFSGADPQINPSKAPEAATAAPPTEKDEGGHRWQWQPNPGGANAGGKWVDVGAAPETAAERAAREATAPTQTVRTEQGGDGNTYTVITIVPKPGQAGSPGQVVLGPNGQAAPNGVPGKPAIEKKETVKGSDGKTYIRVTVQKPDGSVDLYHTDQAGNRTQLPPEATTGFAGEPAGAPEPQLTIGSATTGLQKYSAFLAAQVKLWKDTNGAQGTSPDDATKLMNQRLALVKSSLGEQGTVVDTQTGLLNNATTQRGQSLTETASRRSAAQNIQQNALSTFVPLATHLGPGGGALLAQAVRDTMTGGRAYIDSFGGLRESPEVGQPGQFPALDQIRQQGLAGIQTAAQGGPQIFGARPVAAGGQPAPPVAAAPAAPVLGPAVPPPGPIAPQFDPAAEAARQQAAAQGAGGGAPQPGPIAPSPSPYDATPSGGNVQMAPPPSVPAATNPVTATPITMPAAPPNMGAPGLMAKSSDGAPPPPPGAAFPLDPRPAPTYNNEGVDVTNEQLGNPPGVVEPWPNQGLPPGTLMQGQQPSFMNQYRYGQGAAYDHHGQAAGIGQRLGIEPDVLAAAFGNLYGQPLQMPMQQQQVA